jgi:hypothetical protein
MEQMGYNNEIEQEYDKITKREEVTKIAQLTINNLCDFTRETIKSNNNSFTWDIQSPSENWTVRYLNVCFPYTIGARFSNGEIGHLVFNHSKTGLVFRSQYIGKAN